MSALGEAIEEALGLGHDLIAQAADERRAEPRRRLLLGARGLACMARGLAVDLPRVECAVNSVWAAIADLEARIEDEQRAPSVRATWRVLEGGRAS